MRVSRLYSPFSFLPLLFFSFDVRYKFKMDISLGSMVVICNNTLVVRGNIPEELVGAWKPNRCLVRLGHEIHSLGETFLFARLFPRPMGMEPEEEEAWSIDNWGCRSDCAIDDFEVIEDDGYLCLEFKSLEQPPIEGFTRLAKRFPELKFTLQVVNSDNPSGWILQAIEGELHYVCENTLIVIGDIPEVLKRAWKPNYCLVRLGKEIHSLGETFLFSKLLPRPVGINPEEAEAWTLDNWGCRSDCIIDDFEISEENDYLRLEFESYDKSPIEGFAAIVKRFPFLEFTLEVVEAGDPRGWAVKAIDGELYWFR